MSFDEVDVDAFRVALSVLMQVLASLETLLVLALELVLKQGLVMPVFEPA